MVTKPVIVDGPPGPSNVPSVHTATSPASGLKLMDLYSSYFDVVRADTPDLVSEALRLRYQVYCVENPFEDPSEHPDGLERDRYDAQAAHCLLLHRPTALVA